MKNKYIKITIYLISVIIIFFSIYKVLESRDRLQYTEKKLKVYFPPKNIIFMISDGMGYNTMLAADYYQYGDSNTQQYEAFPIKLAICTYPILVGNYPDNLQWNTGYSPREMWSNFNYAKNNYTESGAASTAMATGHKTYNNSIGKDINYQNLVNLTQIAKMLNKSAGVVTSVPWSHATPAGFVAHTLTRKNYSEIAYEMLLDSKLDVIIGCGNPDYDNDGQPTKNSYKYVGDSFIWLSLKNGDTIFYKMGSQPDTVEDCDGDGIRDPWTLIQDRHEFQNLMIGNTPSRLLGVAKVYETLQQMRSGNQNANPYEVPFLDSSPTLVEMTKAALNVLDNNTNGFFLLIEGGAIDWAAHSNQKGRLIEEQIDFNNAVDAVVEWINKYSSWEETMVIVTSDHECGYVWGPNSGSPSKFNPIVNNGKYNLPGMDFYSNEHTNSLVPFFAKGAGSEIFNLLADEIDPRRGRYIQNSEIAQGIIALWFEDLSFLKSNLSNILLSNEYALNKEPNINFLNYMFLKSPNFLKVKIRKPL